MGKESTIAPKERVNITFKPAIGGAKEEVELPLKNLVVGDFTLRADDTPLEERKPLNIDKDNFEEVMRSHLLRLSCNVKSTVPGKEGELIPVHLKIESMKDFNPDSIVEQVPELKKLMELRQALAALKGPLGNMPAFRKKISTMLEDPGSRDKLLAELGVAGDKDKK